MGEDIDWLVSLLLDFFISLYVYLPVSTTQSSCVESLCTQTCPILWRYIPLNHVLVLSLFCFESSHPGVCYASSTVVSKVRFARQSDDVIKIIVLLGISSFGLQIVFYDTSGQLCG